MSIRRLRVGFASMTSGLMSSDVTTSDTPHSPLHNGEGKGVVNSMLGICMRMLGFDRNQRLLNVLYFCTALYS